MESVYLFWARSFPNYQNLATVPSLLPIWAFYKLMANEQIGQCRYRELAWIPNFWETDKLILVRVSERIKQSLITDTLNSVEQVKHKGFHNSQNRQDERFCGNREKSTTNKSICCSVKFVSQQRGKQSLLLSIVLNLCLSCDVSSRIK